MGFYGRVGIGKNLGDRNLEPSPLMKALLFSLSSVLRFHRLFTFAYNGYFASAAHFE